MNIIRTSGNLTKKEEYKMAEGGTLVKNVEPGTIISTKAYILYEDTNSKGEDVEVLAIKDQSGEIFNTVSQTFKDSYFRMIEACADEPEIWDIEVFHGVTKAGRDYVSCRVA